MDSGRAQNISSSKHVIDSTNNVLNYMMFLKVLSIKYSCAV